MHKIKRQAHRHGWYDNSEPGYGKNWITGRMGGPKRQRDEERDLNLEETRTADDAPNSAEDQRRSMALEENEPYHRPNKSNTYPQSPVVGNLPSGERGDVSSDDRTFSEKPSEDLEKSATQGDSTNRDLNLGDQPKRRGGFLSKFKKHDDDAALSRQSTRTSKKKKKHPKIPFWSQVKAIFGSWINVLLIFVPVGIALEYAGVNKVIVFVINFIAIIPLAAVLSYSTEELALYIGEVLGGLLNATFGNAVELIVSIIALTQGKVLIVQTSLIGSMLSNLLLVLGMCFFFGGINRPEQHFNVTVAQTAASLLALAIGSLIIPTAFVIFGNQDQNSVPVSRGTAVLLLVTYACYLLFQLRTHVDMYNEPSQKVPKRSNGKKDPGATQKGIAMIGAASGAASAGGALNKENLMHDDDDDDDEETPSLSILGAVITLAVSTVFIALCAEYMVSAINSISGSVSQEFIGLILLPIVGNAAEHVTAVTVAIKDKMDLSIGVAIGSSLQIALLLFPIMVLLSWWGVGQNVIVDGAPAVLDFNFDGFLVVVLVISIWLVNYLIGDGKSHWLEGVLLMITYLIIALAAWFYPPNGDGSGEVAG